MGDGGSVYERLEPGMRLRALVADCHAQEDRVAGSVRGSWAQGTWQSLRGSTGGVHSSVVLFMRKM